MSAHKNFYDVTRDMSLLQFLEANPTLRGFAGNFLLYGGILAGHADGYLDESEKEYLAEALSPFMEDTDEKIYTVTSPEQAVAMFAEAMGYLKLNGGEVRIDLFKCLAALVAADGVLDEGEHKFMRTAARGLGIPAEVGKEILLQAFDDDSDG